MGGGYYGSNVQKRFLVKVAFRDRPNAIDAILGKFRVKKDAISEFIQKLVDSKKLQKYKSCFKVTLKAFWYLYGFRDLCMVDSVKKCSEKTLSKLWPKLGLWVSAKSGKVNFEFFNYTHKKEISADKWGN